METAAAKEFWAEEQTIQTKDLWQSAFIMAEGGMLSEVKVRQWRGKREVVFFLRGSNVLELENDYRSGKATCSVLKLQSNINHLKDIIFKEV